MESVDSILTPHIGTGSLGSPCPKRVVHFHRRVFANGPFFRVEGIDTGVRRRTPHSHHGRQLLREKYVRCPARSRSRYHLCRHGRAQLVAKLGRGTNYEQFWPQLMVWRKEKSLIWWIVTQYNRRRRQMLAFMADPQWAHIKFVRLTSPEEIEAWTTAVLEAEVRGAGNRDGRR